MKVLERMPLKQSRTVVCEKCNLNIRISSVAWTDDGIFWDCKMCDSFYRLPGYRGENG